MCDLSRPRVEDWKKKDHHGYDGGNGKAAFNPKRASLELGVIEIAPAMDRSEKSSETQIHDLITASRIRDGCIRQRRTSPNQRDSQPPSYESVAAGSEHRLLAWLSEFNPSSKVVRASSSRADEVPVLLDYGQSHRHEAVSDIIPDCVRYDELFFALQKLSSDENTAYNGVLRLRGWFPDPTRLQCAYVYELPKPVGKPEAYSGLQPRSLLSFLQNGADADGANIPSLENRYRLAYNITSTVSRLHSAGVAHGNLNSNNVLYFVDGKSTNEKIWKGQILRKPHLAGFHQSTLTVTTAEQVSDFSGIYHHPSINSQSSPYKLAHEFYSIGLILLEIGLWMPLGKFRKAKYSLEDFKARLLAVYVKKLSAKCGNHYMRAALYCMTIADEITKHLSGKGPEYSIREASEYESEFCQKVLKPLQHCCKLDEDAEDFDDQFTQLSRDHEYGQSPLQQDSPIMPLRGPSSATISNNSVLQITEPTASVKTSQASRKRQVSKRKIRVWSHEIPPLYTKYWTSVMFPKLERILSKAISRWESYTIDLFMAGEDADTARPTIYLECTSTEKVKRILKHLNKDLRLFNIKIVSGEILRSKAGGGKKKKKKTQKGSKGSKIDAEIGRDGALDQQRLNPSYQAVPSCGASIGAFKNDKHCPPVTLGGAILVDGQTYGMSVHHMLEDDEELELGLGEVPDLRLSMASRQPVQLNEIALRQVSMSQEQPSGLYPFEMAEGADDDVSSEGYGSEFSNAAETYDGTIDEFSYPFDISEDEDNFGKISQDSEEGDFWLSPDFDRRLQLGAAENSEEDGDLGDTLGVKVNHGQDMLVTQPALDDVNEEFFSAEDTMDEEHLSSHAFGHIHASSGIKRSRKGNIIHEIDWALIKIKESRMQAQNIVHGGARYRKASVLDEPSREGVASADLDSSDSYPSRVMSATDLGGLQVHAFGRTSGLQSGTILPTMRMVKMPGRCFASHSWHVTGNFGGN